MDMIEIDLDKKQPATQRLALDYWKQEQLSEDCCWNLYRWEHCLAANFFIVACLINGGW